MSRPNIPAELKRRVLCEAGHHCAIPACRHFEVEIHHIVPWAKCKEHKYENLIPVILNECDIPERDIGAGETFKDLQWTNLHKDWDAGIQRILKVISPEVSEAETYLRDGGAKTKRGDYEGAITNYNQALCTKPDFAIAYLIEELQRAIWDYTLMLFLTLTRHFD